MRSVLTLLAVVLCLPTWAEPSRTDVNPKPPPVPFVRDSGVHANLEASPRVVHSEEVRIDGAGWLRLYFGEVTLGEGSFLRIRSLGDGEVQELDAAALAMWSNTSAYFNGSVVALELVAGPRTTANRVRIEQVAYEQAPEGPESICGTDDRVSSDEDWSGRVEPIGCSAGMWSENGCLVSAGHCFPSVAQSNLIEFRVPLNDAQCNNQHPPVADQFPITDRQKVDAGVGNDFAVAKTGTNNLGQTPFQRYGVIRPIALSVPSVGTPMQIWGYGTDTCIVSGTQQFSEGQVTGLNSGAVFHNADTTGGNSGSSVISGGKIIAAHTHAGCPMNGSTRIDLASFALARANLCISPAALVDFERPAHACGDPLTIILQDQSLIGAGNQSVKLTSTTEGGLGETVTLTPRYAAVFSGSIAAQPVPVSASDGILSVSHGDTVTATYVDADDGQGGQFVPVVATTTIDCLGPEIAAVQATSIDLDSATITWTTDEPADSHVSANGPGGAFEAGDAALVTSHDVPLGGLSACKSYTFSVDSEDAVGNETVDDNGGGLYSFDTACPAATEIPDGTGGSTPLLAKRITNARTLITWGNPCPGTGSQKLLFGPLASVASYTLTGAACGISAAATSFEWNNLVLPGAPVWFLVVKDNGLGVEGSWGQSSFGERNGTTASGKCGAVTKDLVSTCP